MGAALRSLGLSGSELRKTTLPTRPCAPFLLRLLTANRERQLWRGPRRDILKGLEIAGVSGHGGYSDHNLGGGGQSCKRFHRCSPFPVGQASLPAGKARAAARGWEGGTGEGVEPSLQQSHFSPRVSNPRPPEPTASAGTSAVAALFPLVNRMGEVSHPGFLLVGGAVIPRIPAPCHRPRPRRAVIGHAGRGSRVRVALKGHSGKCALGAKFQSCAAWAGGVAGTLLNFFPSGTDLPCELRDSRGAKLPGHAPRSRSGSSTSSRVLRAPQDGTACTGAATRSLSLSPGFSDETSRPPNALCEDVAGTRERAGCGETLCHPREPPRSPRGSRACPSPALVASWRRAALAPIHTRLGSSGCTGTVVSLTPGHTNLGTHQGITNSATEPEIQVCEPGAWRHSSNAADPPAASRAEVSLTLPRSRGSRCAKENFEGRNEMQQRWGAVAFLEGWVSVEVRLGPNSAPQLH